MKPLWLEDQIEKISLNNAVYFFASSYDCVFIMICNIFPPIFFSFWANFTLLYEVNIHLQAKSFGQYMSDNNPLEISLEKKMFQNVIELKISKGNAIFNDENF